MTDVPVIQTYVLDKTEPKGLAFSVADVPVIQSGFRFKDEQGVERHALDYTMTNTFLTCALKFMEEYVKGITLKRQKVSLGFGGAVHHGLAHLYRTGNVAEAARMASEHMEDTEGEDVKTKRNAEILVAAYAQRYFPENWMILDIETPIVFEFGPGLYHFVIPDMVVRENGRIYGVEHKTTRSISYNYFRQFKPNQQLDGQVAGIRAKYGMCDGIIINPIEIQKGGTKDRKTGVMRPSPYFGFGPRDISARTDEDIEWWRRDMVEIYNDIGKRLQSGYFPATRSACNDYEGCGFRELHLNHGDKYIQDEYYQPRTWNPMDRLAEGEAVNDNA